MLGRGQAGPCNLPSAIRDAVAAAAREASLEPGRVRFLSACLGFSGGAAGKRAIVEKVITAENLILTSDAAIAYLEKHKEGTRREGKAPAVLEADWPMDAALQQSYQGVAYQQDSRATMRLTLFGHEGDDIFVGNTFSGPYAYDFPILHVQARQEQDGRQSDAGGPALPGGEEARGGDLLASFCHHFSQAPWFSSMARRFVVACDVISAQHSFALQFRKHASSPSGGGRG